MQSWSDKHASKDAHMIRLVSLRRLFCVYRDRPRRGCGVLCRAGKNGVMAVLLAAVVGLGPGRNFFGDDPGWARKTPPSPVCCIWLFIARPERSEAGRSTGLQIALRSRLDRAGRRWAQGNGRISPGTQLLGVDACVQLRVALCRDNSEY